MAEEKQETQLDEGEEQPTLEDSLKALESDGNSTQAGVEPIEFDPNATYKLGNRTISGDDLINWDKNFTQTRQQNTEELKRTQAEIEALKKENSDLKTYVDEVIKTQTNPASNDYGLGQYGQYDNGQQGYQQNQPQNPVDINKLTAEITKGVLGQLQRQQAENEKRLQSEISVTKQEEELKRKFPGIPIEEIYKAMGEVDKDNLLGMVDHLSKVAEYLANQKAEDKRRRAEEIKNAFVAGSASSKKPEPSIARPKRMTISETRERIRQATAKAAKDYSLLEKGTI